MQDPIPGMRELEHFVIEELVILESKYKFRPPVIRRPLRWVSAIAFPSDAIAIEVCIDWLERDVGFYVVRLECGQLRDEYRTAVYAGKRVRYNLVYLMRVKNWQIDQDVLSRIEAAGNVPLGERTVDFLKARVLEERALLLSCIDRILAEGAGIFEPRRQPPG